MGLAAFALAVMGRELAVYAAQLILNAAWTPLFFGANLFGLRSPTSSCCWRIGVTTALFRPVSRPAALMLVPYLAWGAFASALNLATWAAV